MTVRRRLIGSTAAIALAAVLVLGVPLAVVQTARVGTDQAFRLEREADAVAGLIDDRLEAGQTLTSAQLAPHVVAGHRITVTVGGRSVSAGAALGGAVRRVRASSSRNAVVTASAPRAEESARVRRLWVLIVLLAVGGVGLAVALATLQARRLSRPLEDVARTSAQLGEGDFSARAPRSGVPEIDAIAEALDRSAAQIASLVAREREFSANVSHQLRTPLTALRLRIEELALVQEPHDREQESRAALREADRLEATIVTLLAHAREDRDVRAVRVDVARIAAEHAAVWAPVLARDGRAIHVHADVDEHPDAAACASPGTVGQVLDVLLDNAHRHGAGDVTVTVGLGAGGDAGRMLITVQDAGPGIPSEAREAVFERGSTGARDGTGIGLHLARALAEADGASLRVAREHPARLELRVPRADAPPSPSSPRSLAASPER